MCISSILIIDRKKCPETQRNVRKIGTWSGLYDTCRFVWIEKSINCGFHVDAENHNVIYLSELGYYLDHCFSSLPIACENIRFSSLLAAGDVSRKTSAEEWMFSQDSLPSTWGDSRIEETGMRVLLLWGVNFKISSHLGCSG